MKKKSVSPVIASVLLVAMVVVIALIIFLWFRSLMKESITKSEENIELVCDKVEFDVSYSEGTLYVSNTGNVPIYSLNVKIGSGIGHETKNIKDISSNWPETGLNQGMDFSDTMTLDGKITISPILLGMSNNGEKIYECDIGKYGKEI